MNKAVQFWGVSFGFLFIFFQLLDWVQTVTIPYPALVLGGVALALCSNAGHSLGFLGGDGSVVQRQVPAKPSVVDPLKNQVDI